MSARFSSKDYATAARALMPRGRAWPDDPGTVQSKLLGALAGTFERNDAAASDLLDHGLPGDNPELLAEWEASLGLPDPCAGPNATEAQRRDQVRARFAGGGGQSRGRYIEYARELGFDVEIVNHAPFRAGHSRIGSPLASDAWTFVWTVRVIANRGGLSPGVLACELNAIRPAETTIIIEA